MSGWEISYFEHIIKVETPGNVQRLISDNNNKMASYVVDRNYMSERSEWVFKIVSQRQAVVTAHTGQAQIFYRACEMKQ